MANTPGNMRAKKIFPKVGLRTGKTLISVSIILFLYGITDRNPCFAAIGAVFGLGKFFKGGLQAGGNRTIGTLIGGLIAMPTYWLINFSGSPVPDWVYMLAGLFLVIYVSQILHAEGGIHPGSVVFFVVLCTVIPERYISYTINRIIDTAVGVAVSLSINKLFPSPYESEPVEEEIIEMKHDMEVVD